MSCATSCHLVQLSGMREYNMMPFHIYTFWEDEPLTFMPPTLLQVPEMQKSLVVKEGPDRYNFKVSQNRCMCWFINICSQLRDKCSDQTDTAYLSLSLSALSGCLGLESYKKSDDVNQTCEFAKKTANSSN